ncbi:MAG: 7-carboxy-7-deazaguanine synthase QueE [Bacteroidales bacterium]|nr:7-carboxy-7-deazaguanine synthase QueE [Bacteroidales bacterium]
MTSISDNEFPVSEIFESIQGEGNYSGVSSLFIRFQLCNLTCTWCDTKYTWTRFSDEFKVFGTGEILKIIRNSTKKHIIFTGGEPSFYRLDLLAEDKSKKYHVETNGTLIPSEKLKYTLRDGVTIHREGMKEEIIGTFNWVISPKLSNSKQDIVPEAIEFWSSKEYAVFKFIAGSMDDLDEISSFAQKFSIKTEKIYIGLLGNTPESQIKPFMVEEIMKRNFHFSPRLHVLLWGQQRGK